MDLMKGQRPKMTIHFKNSIGEELFNLYEFRKREFNYNILPKSCQKSSLLCYRKGRDPLSDLSNFCWHNEPVMVKIGVGSAIGNAEAFSPFSSLTRGRIAIFSTAAAKQSCNSIENGPAGHDYCLPLFSTKDQKVSLECKEWQKTIID